MFGVSDSRELFNCKQYRYPCTIPVLWLLSLREKPSSYSHRVIIVLNFVCVFAHPQFLVRTIYCFYVNHRYIGYIIAGMHVSCLLLPRWCETQKPVAVAHPLCCCMHKAISIYMYPCDKKEEQRHPLTSIEKSSGGSRGMMPCNMVVRADACYPVRAGSDKRPPNARRTAAVPSFFRTPFRRIYFSWGVQKKKNHRLHHNNTQITDGKIGQRAVSHKHAAMERLCYDSSSEGEKRYNTAPILMCVYVRAGVRTGISGRLVSHLPIPTKQIVPKKKKQDHEPSENNDSATLSGVCSW